ncbi:MAG: S9 family peptidase [Acidobacteria bacterium]|nr:S9 family peptidase [Acidobacteriota bacterium]
MRALLALAGLAVLATPANPLETLSVERANDPGLSGPIPTRLAWTGNGERLTYLRPSPAGADLYAFDPRRGEEELLLRGGSLTLPAGPDGLDALHHATWMPDDRHLLVPAGGDVYIVDTRSGSVRPLVKTDAVEEFPTASPDGKRVAFVRDNDLYSVDVKTGRQTRLTSTGSDTILNGRLDWVYEEELGNRDGRAFAWAPNSRALAYLQLDQSPVALFPIVDFLPVQNVVTWQRYPTAGMPNSVVRVGVVGIEGDGGAGPERLVPASPDDHYVAPQLVWTPSSRGVAFQQINRRQDELHLRLLPVPDKAHDPLGTPRTVLTERSDTFVNLLLPPRFHRKGRRFLWLSERSGFAHIYDCDLAGACRAVTRGPWMVDARVSFSAAARGQPLALDERTGFVYYTATRKDPRERHLYRVRLDGTGHARLTTEEGTHRVLVSPDGRHYADTWSDAETPPRVWVASRDGTKRWSIEDNPAAPALDFERGTLEWVQLTSRDGATLYGSLLKPPGFDPTKRYPVVVSVYGGPHVQTVTDSWEHVSPFERLLSSRGFLVWQLDNRGSAGRGAAFESAIHRRLGQLELQDQLAGVEHLQGLPYVDASRIGITGSSYGGYMTLYALTHAPGVFRSGVAGAPVTDWSFYDTIYTERYMGTPEDNPEGYANGSPLTRAAQLRAELLIIHGSGDDNVHLANSMAFAAKLIEADRPHRLLVHPRQKHGMRPRADRIARDRATLEHFERTLKRAQAR